MDIYSMWVDRKEVPGDAEQSVSDTPPTTSTHSCKQASRAKLTALAWLGLSEGTVYGSLACK
jgi:hypothetical protein